MKYFLVGLLVLIANSILLWYLAVPGFQAMGWWFVIIAFVEGMLVGRLTGELLAEWQYRDTITRLAEEFEQEYGR